MGNPRTAESAAALRMLPSTDEVMMTRAAQDLLPAVGHNRLVSLARTAIDSIRKKLVENISATVGHSAIYSKDSLLTAASDRLVELWNARRRSRLRRVINATGVVIHTNLGRAPLSVDAMRAVEGASGYCTLEYDLTSGKRGKRGAYVETLLTEITGGDAALVVNNGAAAAFLILTVFASGGEVVVSRGELVEIGGDFRIPDVLVQSGATLKEVGTTNRTKLSDYEKAIGENTNLIMRVHPSNYKIVGFTERPSLAELSDLSRRKGVVLYEDAGSGALVDLSEWGLDDEPLISRAISDGADIVSFSGDKLLGASQAGLIVGHTDLIERVRKHPLYRALRVDKLIYAALESTLESYLRQDAKEEVPVLRMLALTKDELDIRARDFARRLGEDHAKANDLVIEIIPGESVVGGGSGPAVKPETTLVALHHPALSASEIESRLRMGETPVIARIENDKVLLDLRTVQESEERRLIEILWSVGN
jgi:L-seryl-tRNA(Ser) seleniumtransferase